MKNFLFLFFCILTASVVEAASPAFGDFDLNTFSTNATKVKLKNGFRGTNGTLYLDTTIPSGGRISVGGYYLSNNINGDGSFVIWDSGNNAGSSFIGGIWFGNFSGGTINGTNMQSSGNNATNYFHRVTRIGASLVISSNTLASLSALGKGDMAFWSSNGAPYLITSAPDGTLATNYLLASGSAFSGNPNQLATLAGSTRVIDGAILSNIVSFTTFVVTNVFGGGFTTVSNRSISYKDDSGTLGDFIYFDTGQARLGNGSLLLSQGSNYVAAITREGKTLIVSSNTLAALAVLVPGDFALWSSNGVPYYILSSPNGTLTTNAFSSGSGTFNTFVATTTGLTTTGNGTSTATISSSSAVVTQGVAIVYSGGIQSTGAGPTTLYGSVGLTNYVDVSTLGVLFSNVFGIRINNKGMYFSNNSAAVALTYDATAGTLTTVGGFVGPASGLTTLPANQLSSGTVPTARLAYTLATNAINTGIGVSGGVTYTNIAGAIALGGFSSLSASEWNTIIWVVKNASGGNLVVTDPANCFSSDGTRSWTATNATTSVATYVVLQGIWTNRVKMTGF